MLKELCSSLDTNLDCDKRSFWIIDVVLRCALLTHKFECVWEILTEELDEIVLIISQLSELFKWSKQGASK